MKTESTEHNLGDVLREINLPTFALRVLSKSEVGRFFFERDGTGKIEGIQTWKIRFRETTGQSLVVGGNGQKRIRPVRSGSRRNWTCSGANSVENPYART